MLLFVRLEAGYRPPGLWLFRLTTGYCPPRPINSAMRSYWRILKRKQT